MSMAILTEVVAERGGVERLEKELLPERLGQQFNGGLVHFLTELEARRAATRSDVHLEGRHPVEHLQAPVTHQQRVVRHLLQTFCPT